eukprot:PhM_4_TR3736/c0_g1_i1/m.99090
MSQRSNNKNHNRRHEKQLVEKDNDADDHLKVLRDSARTAQSTVAMSNETLTMLSQQNETIDNIDRTLDNTNERLTVANRVVRTMGGFFGALYGVVAPSSKKKTHSTSAAAGPSNVPPDELREHALNVKRQNIAREYGVTTTSTTTTKTTPQGGDSTLLTVRDDDDTLLDSISNSVGQLKHNALVTRDTLEYQNGRLASIDAKVDVTSERIRKTTAKVRELT